MTSEPPGLVALTSADVNSAAEVLARAFRDDPLWAFYVSDERARRDRLDVVFRVLLHYGLRYGEAQATSPAMEGVAIWLPSAQARFTLWRALACGAAVVPFRLGLVSAGRQAFGIRYLAGVHRRLVPYPHWHLWTMGVDPAHRGKGFAGVLLRPVLARLDEQDMACYLETQNRANVPLYERYGFRVAGTDRIPGSSVRSWAMIRPPAGDR